MGTVVYIESFGNPHETWLYRQVKDCAVPVLCHEYSNEDLFPYNAVDVVPKRPGAHARFRGRYRLPRNTERALKRKLTDLGATLIHAHFGPAGLRALPLARKLGLRLMVTFHGADANVLPDRDAAYARGLSGLFDYSERIVTVSGFLAARLVGLGCPEERIEIVPMGVGLPRIPARRKRKTIRAVTVARLHPVKGVPDLVDALAAARSQDVPLELDIVGEGPERHAVEERVRKLDLQKVVRLHGSLPPTEIEPLLMAADLFVLNSRPTDSEDVDGLPVSLLEGMAAGLCVLGTRAGGVPEVVQHEQNGLLVPARDTEALAAQLVRAAGDRDLRLRLGKAARATVAAEFGAHPTAERLLELYEVSA